MVLLEQLVDEIERDQVFRSKCKFTVLKNYGQIVKIIEPLKFRRWLSVVREEIIRPHYANFDAYDCEMIVLGSNGIRNFCSRLAYVAEKAVAGGSTGDIVVPGEVQCFIELINQSLGLNNKKTKSKSSAEYDYYCELSKRNVLFLNVDLNRCAYEDWVYTVCMIRLVNRILQLATRPIAIIDLRDSYHMHAADLGLMSANLLLNKNNNNFFCHEPEMCLLEDLHGDAQMDSVFKLYTGASYLSSGGHYHVRLLDCMGSAADLKQMMVAIRVLEQKGFGLSKLYIPLPLSGNSIR